jgi:hypothetical protein
MRLQHIGPISTACGVGFGISAATKSNMPTEVAAVQITLLRQAQHVSFEKRGLAMIYTSSHNGHQ